MVHNGPYPEEGMSEVMLKEKILIPTILQKYEIFSRHNLFRRKYVYMYVHRHPLKSPEKNMAMRVKLQMCDGTDKPWK